MSEHTEPTPPDGAAADEVVAQHVSDEDVAAEDTVVAEEDAAADDLAAEDAEQAPDAEVDEDAPADLLVLDTWQLSMPATGDAAVDAALARLVDVDGLPLSEHAEVYEAVHADLHAALADLDRG